VYWEKFMGLQILWIQGFVLLHGKQ